MNIDSTIFKAYDIRGIYNDNLTDELVKSIGNNFASLMKEQTIIIGRDMRLSSENIFNALAEGIKKTGKDVIDIGLVSTDTTYFASGFLGYPSIMITASHNPKEWNGFKMTFANAKPFGQEEIQELKTNIEKNKYTAVENSGHIESIDILPDYVKKSFTFIKTEKIKPLKIVIDAGNGMAGKIVPIFFASLPCEIIPLYFELDGAFPNHQPSPIESKNMVDLQKKVIEEKADFGMAFDGDADRVFFIDEKAQIIKGDIIVAMLAEYFLKNNPQEKIIYDLRCSHIISEIIEKNNGRPVISKVGHSFIKKLMRETNAIFGGELSGHYYYRDNYMVDSGIITALIMTEIISLSNKKLSELLINYSKYYNIEETNFKVDDKDKKINELKEKYRDGQQNELDGLTVEYKNWWFNVRPSNTEPFLRLNLEAKTKELMKEKKEELTQFITS